MQSDVRGQPIVRPYEIRAVEARRHEALHERDELDLDPEVDAAPVADVINNTLSARGAQRVGAERARDGDARHVARLDILREAAVAEILLRPLAWW